MIPLVVMGCIGQPVASPLPEEPPMKPEDRYHAWLSAREPGATGVEEPSLALGGFRFFSVRTERGKRQEAAASDLTLVAKDGMGDWAAFLQSGPAETVAQRVAWLQGAPSLITPASPSLVSFEKKTPGVAGKVTAPRVDVEGGTVRLDAWYVFQPGGQVSHLVVEGRAGGGTLTWTPYKP